MMRFELIEVYRGNEKIYFGDGRHPFAKMDVPSERLIHEFLANHAHAVCRGYVEEIVETCGMQVTKPLMIT